MGKENDWYSDDEWECHTRDSDLPIKYRCPCGSTDGFTLEHAETILNDLIKKEKKVPQSLIESIKVCRHTIPFKKRTK